MSEKTREGRPRRELIRLTAGLVISFVFLSIGTLKSTRIRTRSPLRETSLMESLEERDMMESEERGKRKGEGRVVGGGSSLESRCRRLQDRLQRPKPDRPLGES